MIYVQNLIRILSKEHLKEITNLPLLKNERLIFDFLLKHKNQNEKEVKEIALALNLSPGNFRKYASNLLNSCYNFLEPAGGHKLIGKIAAYNLSANVKQELNKQLRTLEKENDFESIKTLLSKAMRSFMILNVQDFDEKYIKKMINKFQSIDPNFENDNRYHTMLLKSYRTELFHLDWNPNFKGKKKAKKIEYYKAEHIKYNELLTIINDVHLKNWIYSFNNIYNEVISQDVEKYGINIMNHYNFIKENESHFDAPMVNSVYCKPAYLYVAKDDFISAEKAFENALKRDYKTFIGSPHHSGSYAQILLTNGKFNEAEEIYLKGFYFEKDKVGPADKVDTPNTASMAIINILQNKFDLAFERILAAYEGIKKSYSYSFDSIIKTVEIAYYYFMKNEETAERLISNAIKFQDYHKEMKASEFFKKTTRQLKQANDLRYNEKDKTALINEIEDSFSAFSFLKPLFLKLIEEARN